MTTAIFFLLDPFAIVCILARSTVLQSTHTASPDMLFLGLTLPFIVDVIYRCAQKDGNQISASAWGERQRERAGICFLSRCWQPRWMARFHFQIKKPSLTLHCPQTLVAAACHFRGGVMTSSDICCLFLSPWPSTAFTTNWGSLGNIHNVVHKMGYAWPKSGRSFSKTYGNARKGESG